LWIYGNQIVELPQEIGNIPDLRIFQ